MLLERCHEIAEMPWTCVEMDYFQLKKQRGLPLLWAWKIKWQKNQEAILGRWSSTSRVLDTEKSKEHEEQQDVQFGHRRLTGSRPGRRRAGRTVKCQILEAFESQIKDLIFSLGNHRNFLRKE